MGQRFYDWLNTELRRLLAVLRPEWDQDARDEIVQQAQIKVWRLLEDGRKAEDDISRAFLRRVCENLIIDQYRYRRRRPEEPLEVTVAEPPRSPTADPEHDALSRDLGRRIRDALAELNPRYRRAVVLWLQGHSIAQVARLLGVSYKVAENRVNRGRNQLRDLLDGDR